MKAMFIIMATLCGWMGVRPAFSSEAPAPSGTDDRLVAIDILLQPDQAMIGKAQSLNARLRGNYPAGYALDSLHAPHVTLLQRFVRVKDFDGVTAAVAKVLADEQPTKLKLKVSGLYHAMWSGVAVTVLVIERTPELMQLHQKIVDAVAPFSQGGATAGAFVGADANAETIGYVETFVPASSGEHYAPHVTAGVATEAFVKGLEAEPFKRFTFKPAGVAVYQLGNFGTAAKHLWQAPKSKK